MWAQATKRGPRMTSMRTQKVVLPLFPVLILEALVRLRRDSLIRTIYVPIHRA